MRSLALVLVLAPSIAAADSATAIVYRHVPPAVVDATWYPWRSDAPVVTEGRTEKVAPDATVSIHAAAGFPGVVILRAQNGTYLVDGPFTCPERDAMRRLPTIWRRTVRGGVAVPATDLNPPLEWMAADGHPGEAWPRCGWRDSRRWECWAVPVADAGLVVTDVAGRVWWAAVSTADHVDNVMHSDAWGRLLVIRGEGGAQVAHLKVEAMRLLSPAPPRIRSVRLRKAAFEEARVITLGSSVWVSGSASPPASWLEVHGEASAPAYLPLDELAAGARSAPVFVRLDEERAIDGTVRGPGGQPAVGALVTVFRLVDPPDPSGTAKLKRRRVSEAETQTDDSGRFAVASLGYETYEVLAWHPQLGRVSRLLDSSDRHLDLRIDAAAVVRGRILVGGKPAAGVDIKTQPDATAFIDADDVVDVKGGDGVTGADGRFVVALAPAGGGELRIGGGSFPGKRVPLPRGTSASIDLGDIDLGSSLVVTLILDQDSACEVRAVGPLDRLGLHVIQTRRTGPGLFEARLPEPGTWTFVMSCGETERPLTPSVVTVTERTRSVQLAVR